MLFSRRVCFYHDSPDDRCEENLPSQSEHLEGKHLGGKKIDNSPLDYELIDDFKARVWIQVISFRRNLRK